MCVCVCVQYTVFIAAVAGSITLALCGIIAARFVVARRQRRRAERRRRQGLDAGGGWEGVEMRAGVRTQSKGLHPMVRVCGTHTHTHRMFHICSYAG